MNSGSLSSIAGVNDIDGGLPPGKISYFRGFKRVLLYSSYLQLNPDLILNDCSIRVIDCALLDLSFASFPLLALSSENMGSHSFHQYFTHNHSALVQLHVLTTLSFPSVNL